MQYGGWYNNPETGRNQRWWNGVWTDGEEPGAASSPGGQATSSVAPFDFNYEEAAKEAYGELGPYYDRLLKESQGDLNLAISRLTEDYDRGVRIRSEDATLGNEQDVAANQRNALARGIYNTSLFEPFGAGQRGIADIANPNNPFGMNIANRNRGLTRANEASTIDKSRSLVDLPEKQRRYEANLEQERRRESASLVESKANKALQKYQTSLTLA